LSIAKGRWKGDERVVKGTGEIITLVKGDEN